MQSGSIATASSAPMTMTFGRAPALPLLGSLPLFASNPLSFLLRAAQRGAIVDMRLPGIQSYLLTEPDDIQHVLTTMSRSVIKDVFLRDLRRVVGDGLLTSEGDFWRRQRRLSQPAFHHKRLITYAAQMVDSAEAAAGSLRDGQVLDVHALLMKLTLDIVSRTLFGADASRDHDQVGSALHVIMQRYASTLPFAVPGYDKLPIAANRRFREAVASLDATILDIIERRRADPTDRGDLLSMLLAAQDDDGGRMTTTQLRDEAITLYLAGHETTANALSWALMLLAEDPTSDRRLAASLTSTLGDRAPTLEDLPALSHVENVVSEAMRLYPPAWSIGREVVEPFEMRGVHFAKGNQIWISQWAMHRDARFFTRPRRFWPERWEGGLAKRLPKFAYFPFGGGPRICIGNAFAMMEMTLVLATLSRRFRFELMPNQPIVPLPSVTLRPRDGIKMLVRARR